ncbi:MAG TPA: LysR substrate-binding domain-containing protein, partial [Polyangiaceae bacterium]|nr:LysR substrate-binding domain-containing protein [Polyangiaceae bacterium]
MLHASRANLNLLVVLHAVLTEGGVTAAGKKLGLSQTAVSNALARLREQFGDPLVVRRGRGVVPTPRAAAMLGELGGALQTLDRLLAPAEGFDPRRCERTFSLALTDDQEVADLPRVFRRFARAMPLAALRVETVESLVAGDGLAAGTVDAALGPSMLRSPGLRQAPLRVERGVLVVRRDHPAVGPGGRLSRADLARLPWVDVRVAGDDGVGRRLAHQALATSGLAPPMRCSVPHFFAAAAVVASSDAVAGLPARFAERLAAWLPLRVVEGPTP